MTSSATTTRRERVVVVGLIYLISLIVLSCTFYYIVTNMSMIIERDPSFYWDRSYTLWEMLQKKGVLAWASTIVFSLTENHTYIPSVIPSLAFLLFSSDSIWVYGLTLIVVYLAPIPAVGALVLGGGRAERSKAEIVTAGMALLAAMYPFAVRLMPTSPDFGGNLFVSVALYFAAMAFIMLTAAREGASLRPMALTILFFLAALFLSVVFRRWYAFDVLGLMAGFSVAILVVAMYRGRTFAIWTFQSLALAGIILGLLLAPILVPKLMVVSSGGIFEGAYDAYRANYLLTFRMFGTAELLCFASIALVALPLHRSVSRGFLIAIMAGNIIGLLLFLYIQAPGVHHFSLIWPMLLASISAIVGRLFDSQPAPRTRATFAAVAMAVAAIVVAAEFPYEARIDPHVAAYRQIADKIVDKKLQNKRFCVLGNQDIYFSLIENLWQVKGGHRGDLPNSVRIPEVDFGTADRYGQGGLTRGIALCDWVLTMDGLGLHHEPKFHRILRYHHQQIFDPASILGSAYEVDERFDAGFSSPLVFLKRKQGVTVDAEAFKKDYLDWLAKDKIELP